MRSARPLTMAILPPTLKGRPLVQLDVDILLGGRCRLRLGGGRQGLQVNYLAANDRIEVRLTGSILSSLYRGS